MDLLDYQINTIKEVYGNYINDQKYVTKSEILNYYNYNSNFKNCIESPDLLTIVSSYHGFTDYPLTVNRNENISNKDISKIRISEEIIKSHLSYFKIINEKDIDWENAYLKYSGNYQTDELERPIEYKQLIANLNSDNKYELDAIDKNTFNSYLFTRGLPSYIANTYDIFNIIDYLFVKLNALKFLLKVVKEQHENVATYKTNPA